MVPLPHVEETHVKTMLNLLGIRSRSVGFATLQTKGDIITAAVERDRVARSLQYSYSGEQHDDLSSLMREAG